MTDNLNNKQGKRNLSSLLATASVLIIVAAYLIYGSLRGSQESGSPVPQKTAVPIAQGSPEVPSVTPEARIYTPPDAEADAMIGQMVYEHAIPNGLDSRSLFNPTSIAIDTSVDPYRLFVVDSGNKRLLGFANPLSAPPVQASLVLCQTNFYTSRFYEDQTGETKYWYPYGVAVDSAGNVYLSDKLHSKVVEFDKPFETDSLPDRLFGQPKFYIWKPEYGRGFVAFPQGLCIDQKTGTLWVADTGNNRVIAYLSPLTTDATADFILGQLGNYSSRQGNAGGLGPASLRVPTSVALKGDDLIVTDAINNRVLVYVDPLNTDATADYVYGQDDFTKEEMGCGPTRFSRPESACADSQGRIVVADPKNHRVVAYPAPGSSSRDPIGLWGQKDYVTPQREALVAGAGNLQFPTTCVFSPDGVLWIVDSLNHRVLGYKGGIDGDKDADYVIGQIDVYHGSQNFVDDRCLYFPRDVAIDRTKEPNRLYVADFENARVLGFNSVENLSYDVSATIVLGQPDPYTTSIGTTNAKCNFTTSVAVDPTGGVYVAERDNSRVLWFDSPFEKDTIADLVIGQKDFTSGLANAGGVASATTLNRPEGVAVDPEGNLYVADSRNHRVLRFDNPTKTDTVADAVWGQFGKFDSGAENAGQTRGPGTFSYPMKLDISDTGLLAVADTNNYRVLVFDVRSATPQVPIKVYGQNGNFTTASYNMNDVNARTLGGPEGTLFIGDDLYIADTANNRVLFFRDVRNGDDAADVVFGQNGDFTTANIGAHLTSAKNLWLPTGIDLDSAGSLYVTDREQNRVVVYRQPEPQNVQPGPTIGQ